MVITTKQEHIDLLKTAYSMNGGTWKSFNLAGIRNEEKMSEDVFNDVLIASTDEMMMLSVGTTDPGVSATMKRKDGANHLVEGYHTGIWGVEFRQKYGMDVFAQVGNVTTWDDKNKNFKHDDGDILSENKGPEWGIFGHSRKSQDEKIGEASWGCQVWKFPDDFRKVMKAAKESGLSGFDYMLMTLKQEVEELYRLIYAG